MVSRARILYIDHKEIGHITRNTNKRKINLYTFDYQIPKGILRGIETRDATAVLATVDSDTG